MNFYEIPSAFLVALLFTLLFAVLSSRRGPWRVIVLYFFIIFLVTWAGQLWITPFGPLILGISLFPMLFIAVIFSFLIFALTPPRFSSVKSKDPAGEEGPLLMVGMFFWFLIILLISSIVIGYYKMPQALNGTDPRSLYQ